MLQWNQLVILIIVTWTINVAAAQEQFFVDVEEDEDHDDDLDEYFKGLLEGLRIIMPIGFPEFGLPILEPAFFEKQEFSVRNNSNNVYLLLQNMSIHGLSSYQVPKLRVSLPSFRLRVNVVLPLIRADGRYFANGTAMYVLPVKGHGRWRVRIVNLKINIVLHLTRTGDTVAMKIVSLTGDMEKFDSHFENLLGEGNLSKVLNSFVRKNARNFVGRVMDRLRNTIDGALGRFTDIVDSTIFDDYGKKKPK